MQHLKKIINCVFLTGLVLFWTGCATTKMALQEAPKGGFVREVDEPSTRGMLQRVSPDEMFVHGRFCVSPTGESITFAGRSGRHRETIQLWKIPLLGGSPVKITSGGEDDCESPSFTPDGEFIVYSSGGTMWRIQANGAGGRTKIPGSGMGIDFAPHVAFNGRIAFCSLQHATSQGYGSAAQMASIKSFIWICNPNGSELTQLREGEYPFWSPDASRIVFSHQKDLWSIRADGTDLTQLTSTPHIEEGVPTYSDDGEYIVYASNEGKDGKPMRNDFNIWRMKADGTEKTQITELKSWDSWPIQIRKDVLFLSGRAATDMHGRLQRIWRLTSAQ